MDSRVSNPYPCRGCGNQIRMILMRSTNRTMPVNAEKISGDGWKSLVTENGVTIAKAGFDVEGYEPHWGYCKKADQFRRKVTR